MSRKIVMVACLCVAFGVVTDVALGFPGPPVIESTSVSRVSETSVTLEAQIDPRGLSTSYEFWIECQRAPGLAYSACEPLSGSSPRTQGAIAAGHETSQTVGGEIDGLEPGYGYKYAVAATSAGGTSESRGNFVETPLPGTCPLACSFIKPYESTVSQAEWEASRKYAEGAPAREAERRKAAEQSQRNTSESGANAGSPSAGNTPRPANRAASECVVPTLTGDSLRKARLALRSAHCRLGRVSRPKVRRRAVLVVVGQSPAHGRRLAQGARVAVRLDVRRKRKGR